MNNFLKERILTTEVLLEKGQVLCGQVQMVIDRLYAKHSESPLPQYLNGHLLVAALEAMFPKLHTACYGFFIDVVPVVEGVIVEEGWKLHSLTSKTPGSIPLSVMMKSLPHSWLLHKESNTIIDVLPLGCKPGVTYPVCRPPHPNRPKYIMNMRVFEACGGKLPDRSSVNKLRRDLEQWSKNMAPAFITA